MATEQIEMKFTSPALKFTNSALTVDQRIGAALGVGEEFDDQTCIARLVELAQLLGREKVDSAASHIAEIDELRAEIFSIREEQMNQLALSQLNVANLIGVFAAVIRNVQ